MPEPKSDGEMVAVRIAAIGVRVELSDSGNLFIALVHPCGCCATGNEMSPENADKLIELIAFQRDQALLRRNQPAHVMPEETRA